MNGKRNIKEWKKNLRARHRQTRERMDPKKKLQWDAAIENRLFALPEYRRADILFTYVSKASEVDTFGIIRRALADGKAVAVPRCVPGTFEMEFYYIRSPQELEKGAFGVLEPIPESSRKVEKETGGLCVVPGLAFDSNGFRLGYGKGYYDRFLSGFHGVTAGICYNSCVQWELPHGYFDRPVDILVTERYLRRIAVRKPGAHACK